jgi:hypothetical protein
MTVYPDMHNAFRLNLDKSSSLVGNPDFLPEEIDFWLNEAQERFVKQRLFGNNFRHEGVEQGQKRTDDLKTLIIGLSAISLTSSLLGSNVKEAVIPTIASAPYLFYLHSTVYNVSGNSLNTGKTINSENIDSYIKDSINNPYIRKPLVYLYGGSWTSPNPTIAFIYGDEFIPTSFDMVYIKKPRVLTYTTISGYQTNIPELPEETHKEIVNIAVGLVIENIESPRSQTFVPLNQSNIE